MSPTTDVISLNDWFGMFWFGILILGSFIVFQYYRPGSILFKRRQFKTIFGIDPKLPIPPEVLEQDVSERLRKQACTISRICQFRDKARKRLPEPSDRHNRQLALYEYGLIEGDVREVVAQFKWDVRVARAYGVKTSAAHSWSDYLTEEELKKSSESVRANAAKSKTRHLFHKTQFEPVW